jgi:regulator of replication initiation timing
MKCFAFNEKGGDLMDIATAYTAIKFIKDSLSVIVNAKIESAAKDKINEMLDKIGPIQDTLFYLRGELSQLQTENHELNEKLKTAEDWKAKLAEYELKETEGGAVVYRFKGGPGHYICPNCTNKKEIQILQGRKGNMSGDLECPGCNKTFPVNLERDFDPTESDDD